MYVKAENSNREGKTAAIHLSAVCFGVNVAEKIIVFCLYLIATQSCAILVICIIVWTLEAAHGCRLSVTIGNKLLFFRISLLLRCMKCEKLFCHSQQFSQRKMAALVIFG